VGEAKRRAAPKPSSGLVEKVRAHDLALGEALYAAHREYNEARRRHTPPTAVAVAVLRRP